MKAKVEKKRLAVLRILRESETPLSSSRITEQLLAMGHDVSDRTVRLYLLDLDREGLTENLGKRGRRITEIGERELSTARAYEKVGLLAVKIDRMAYSMDFDLQKRTGTIVMNASLIESTQIERAIPLITHVFQSGYGMGKLLALFGPGERMGQDTVPMGMVGIGTICTITLNGILLARGIPSNSKFGGLLELKDHLPTRFVEIIHYNGTTLDPHEIFIRSHMTACMWASESGNGRIVAGLSEVPSETRSRVIEIVRQLEKIGLGGFMVIGWPGQPVLEVPVNEGRVAAICIGGMNPIAILEETGIQVHLRAMAGLADYNSFFHYQQLEDRMRQLEL